MATTDLVYPDWISKPGRARANAMLSTNADGITGAQVVDCGGLTLCGLSVSTGSSDANYSFRGGHTSTGSLQTLVNSTGDVITKGSTVAGVTPGKTILFDPAPFMGVRFIQVMTGTTAAPLATGSSGVTIGLLLAPVGKLGGF